jgi:predicted phage tail protein
MSDESEKIQQFQDKMALIRKAEREKLEILEEKENAKRQKLEEQRRKELLRQNRAAHKKELEIKRRKQRGKETVEGVKSAGLFVGFLGCWTIVMMPILFIGLSVAISSGSLAPLIPAIGFFVLTLLALRVAGRKK